MKGKTIIKVMIMGILVVTGFMLTSIKAEASGVPFSLEPLMEDIKGQDKDVSSYFSFTTDKENIHKDLKFKVTNLLDKKQKIKVTVVDAYTSSNGYIHYTDKGQDNSKIIDKEYKMSNYLDLEQGNVIELEPNEEKIISAKLDINKGVGTVLGGVSFKTLGEKENLEEKDGTSFNIQNEINLVVGTVVNFRSNEKINFEVSKPYMDPLPAYFSIRLPIKMEAPYLKSGVKIEYEVFKTKDKETMFKNNRELDFAPKTETDLLLPWESKTIEENQPYTIKGKIVYKDIDGKTKEKTFGEEFEYEKDEEKSTIFDNTTLKVPSVKGSDLWVYVVGIIIVIIVTYYILLFRKRYVYYSTDKDVHKVIDKRDNLYKEILEKNKDGLNIKTKDVKLYKHIYYFDRKNEIFIHRRTKNI